MNTQIMNTTDPIFQRIQEHAAARANVIAARGTTDKQMDAACSAANDGMSRLFESVPQTSAGVVALLHHIAEMWPDYLEHEDHEHFEPLIRTFASIALPSTAPDPIYALIAAHDRAGLAELAECGKETDIPLSVSEARHAAQRELFAVCPTTIEGVRALAAHVLKWWRDFFDDTSDPLEPLFRGLASGGTAEPTRAEITTKPNAGDDVDPVFLAIHRNWYAWRTYTAACDLPGCGKRGDTDDAEVARTLERYDDTWRELGEARPRTLAGLAAVFEYIHTVDEHMDFRGSDPDLVGELFRKMAYSVRVLDMGAASNPALLKPAPEFHVRLMREIADHCRHELAKCA